MHPCSYAWFALDVGSFGWLRGASLWDGAARPPAGRLLPLGRLYATLSRLGRGKKALPGVPRSALAPWPARWPPQAPVRRAAAGAALVSSGVSAADSPPAAGLPDWQAGCGACAQAADLAALPAAQQRRCAERCGFWPAQRLVISSMPAQ